MTEEVGRTGTARRWWIIGAAAVVVVLLVWFAIVASGGGGPSSTGPVSTAASASPSSAPSVPEPSIPSATASGTPTVEPTRKPSSVSTGLDGKVETAPGITASVKAIEAVDGKARGPGEVAGPALRVTIVVTNGSAKAIRTDLGLINLYYGKDRTPAGTLSGPGAAPFPTEIAAGSTGTGTTVFGVPKGARGDIRIEFSYSTDAPVVIFSGAA